MQVERRKHLRILTIRNFGRALLVLVLALAAANVISELRPSHRGEYGRLTLRDEPVVVVKHPEVVTEAEVPEAPATMPPTSFLSGAPAAPPAVSFAQQSKNPAGEAAGAPLSKVKIVGGADGIRVESTQPDATPKLSGGIFRQ